MDNHPIPQDVTGFQFKLIGEMTIKQFAYLAGGVVIGWFIFSIPIPLLLRLPFASLFVFAGIILSFIPIEGRPADIIARHFFKALFTPNQYIYQQNGRTDFMLDSLPTSRSVAVPPPLASSLHVTSAPSLQTMVPAVTVPQPQKITHAVPNEEKTQLPLAPILAIPQQLPPQSDKQEFNIVKKQLEDTLGEKKQLEEELRLLKQQVVAQQHTIVTPSIATATSESPRVRKLPKPQNAPAAGLPMTSYSGNVLTGIVKDSRGNILPNMLVEVKDNDGNPVRAFKTNALGQFASATPLSNGTYTLFVEDPTNTHTFEGIELVASGDIIQPIQLISVDAREELRKELFG